LKWSISTPQVIVSQFVKIIQSVTGGVTGLRKVENTGDAVTCITAVMSLMTMNVENVEELRDLDTDAIVNMEHLGQI